MTRLRKIMLEERQRRNYSEITTRKYLQVVSDFAKYFGKSPDKLGPNELRSYQAYLLTALATEVFLGDSRFAAASNDS
jgi:integrase/recombinase XerD